MNENAFTMNINIILNISLFIARDIAPHFKDVRPVAQVLIITSSNQRGLSPMILIT